MTAPQKVRALHRAQNANAPEAGAKLNTTSQPAETGFAEREKAWEWEERTRGSSHSPSSWLAAWVVRPKRTEGKSESPSIG